MEWRTHAPQFIATLAAPLVALTCAIVTNVAFMIRQQMMPLNLPTGVADSQVAIIRSVALDRKLVCIPCFGCTNQPVAAERISA